jgi:class 3 adenylate cyclase
LDDDDVTGGRLGRATLRALASDRRSAGSLLLGHEQAIRVFRRVSGFWGTIVGTMAVVVAAVLAIEPVDGVNATGALIVGLSAMALGLAYLVMGDRAGEAQLTALSLGALVGMVVEVWFLGPRYEMAMVVPALACMQSLLYLRRRVTLTGHLLVVGSYTTMVLLADGYPLPWLRVLILVTTIGATSSVLAWIIGQIEHLATKERAAQADLAQATEELEEANAQLEERVGRQGEEIGSLQQLRRFVSPQVAEALLADGIESLVPHRARIAVLFCDLRGFTSFSSVAEPEEVIEVLEAFYATVGLALDAQQATVGSFAGDGIMAYFGDPVPLEDPAGTAVELAVDLNDQMREVVAGWKRRGMDVGCGMGLAFGFATVGPVGFDGRTDYTALGPTVNLASRLCDLAGDGEILIDGRAHAAVESRVTSDARMLEVRGFRMPVPAHRVLGWHGREPLRLVGTEG